MNVRMLSIVALGALLAANVIRAGDSNANYGRVSGAATPPRLLSPANRAANDSDAPDFDEFMRTPSAKHVSARPTRAESVLVADAKTGPIDPAEPEFERAPAPQRSTAAAAALTPNATAQFRTQSKQRRPGSATPATYNAARSVPASAPRSRPVTATSSPQAQRATERLWQDSDKKGSFPSSYAAAFAAEQQDGGPATMNGAEGIGPGVFTDQDGGYGDCDGGTCGAGCGPNWSACYNCCGWFGSVDYLLLKPSFSENTAYIARTVHVDGSGPTDRVTTTDRVVTRNFGYSSGIRTSLGYRFCDCGGEIRFTYWNYNNSSDQTTPGAAADGSSIFIGQLETVAQSPGQRLLIHNNLNFNLYDIEYAKCLCYGGCGSACNPCNYCQPWSLKYFAGVRIADIRRQDNGLLQNPPGAGSGFPAAWFVNGDFVGAGPRVGLEGRRLFGSGRASLFARTNLSLLLGGWDLGETKNTPASSPTVQSNYFDSHTRMIPVAEIDLGGNYQITRNLNIGAGYMFQAWWDLGAFEQIQGNVFLAPIDDANIMALSGLFARIEMCF